MKTKKIIKIKITFVILLLISCSPFRIVQYEYQTFDDLELDYIFPTFETVILYVEDINRFKEIPIDECRKWPWELMKTLPTGHRHEVDIIDKICLFLYLSKESKLFQMDYGGYFIRELGPKKEENWCATDDEGNYIYNHIDGYQFNSRFNFKIMMNRIVGKLCE